jgi:hypothetical protein
MVVERHGAVVNVEFFFQFEQFLIVGEGTSYEYAVGLAAKYGEASHDPRGFKWIVVTQYDVVVPNAVSNDMSIRSWQDNAWLNHQNQRQNLADALAKNLVRRAAQFSATDAGHWAAVLGAYGPFDACVFNNPHIGYGVHMCVVMGLIQWVAGGGIPQQRARRFANQKGMAVSVYSLGYDDPPHPPLTRLQLNGLLGPVGAADPQATVESRNRQGWFVRHNVAGCLNHRNNATDVVGGQFDPADCTALAPTIQQAFAYAANQGAIANYGALAEFADNTVRVHYSSTQNTLGLQKFLLRSYRFHGPTVLKHGGWLYVNCSTSFSGELQAGFNFDDGGGAGPQAVGGMADIALWAGRDTFVYYSTNFTSNNKHPSWFSEWNFNPHEPGLGGAHVYGLQNP